MRCSFRHRLRGLFFVVGVCCVGGLLAAFGGCGRGDAEELGITLVAPLSVSVGREVSVPLAVPVAAAMGGAGKGGAAADAGALVDWEWRSLTLPDLDMRLRRPSLTAYTLGRAVWRWTPVATDQGEQEMEFVARIPTMHAAGTARLRFFVDSGGAAALFREPVGEGTTLDLRRADCVHVAIVVETSASSHVDLTLGNNPPDTARLLPISDTTGELVFCPNAEQIAADTVYPFTLQATDDRQTIEKSYVIVLRRAT